MSKNLLKKPPKTSLLKIKTLVLSLGKKPIIERKSNITATNKRFVTGFLWNKRKKS